MSGLKLLVDTNVLIGLEDAQPVKSSLAELVRLCGENGVSLFVDGANYDDVERDSDIARRKITLSKLEKFPRLRGVPLQNDTQVAARFGLIKNDNDRSDVRLLAAVDAKAVEVKTLGCTGEPKRPHLVTMSSRSRMPSNG
jgi:hypothetical protein